MLRGRVAAPVFLCPAEIAEMTEILAAPEVRQRYCCKAHPSF